MALQVLTGTCVLYITSCDIQINFLTVSHLTYYCIWASKPTQFCIQLHGEIRWCGYKTEKIHGYR